MLISKNHKQPNIIDDKTSFRGILNSKSDVSLDGNAEGIIFTSGTIYITKKGHFNGDILCANAEIEGCFSGELIVLHSLNIKKGSIVEGEIKFNQLIVDSGAIFNAKSKIHSYEEGFEIFKKNSKQEFVKAKSERLYSKKNQNKSLRKGIYPDSLYFNDIRKLIRQLNENEVLIKERTTWKKKYYYQLKKNNKNYLNKEADSKSWEKINNLFEKKLIKEMPSIRKPLYVGNLIEINDKHIQFKNFKNNSIIKDYIKKCEDKSEFFNDQKIKYDFSYNDFLIYLNTNIKNSNHLNVSKFDKETNLILPKNKKISSKIILKSFNLNLEVFDEIIEFKYSLNKIKDFKMLYIFNKI